jgi:hypothetical protein
MSTSSGGSSSCSRKLANTPDVHRIPANAARRELQSRSRQGGDRGTRQGDERQDGIAEIVQRAISRRRRLSCPRKRAYTLYAGMTR